MCSNESAIIEASFAFPRYQVAQILMPSQSHYHGTHSQPASCQVIEGNEAMAVILMNSDELRMYSMVLSIGLALKSLPSGSRAGKTCSIISLSLPGGAPSCLLTGVAKVHRVAWLLHTYLALMVAN
nr:hypothetical protein Iba_chr01dCG1060 [Ipomoea batatas]